MPHDSSVFKIGSGIFVKPTICYATPDSKYLYVLNSSKITGQAVSLTPCSINSATGALTARMGVTPNTSAWAMAIDPLGKPTSTAFGASATLETYTIDGSTGKGGDIELSDSLLQTASYNS